jgi:hypothetical protein
MHRLACFSAKLSAKRILGPRCPELRTRIGRIEGRQSVESHSANSRKRGRGMQNNNVGFGGV